MNETKRMLETLKRCLRARGVTYGRLGKTLGLSESSVKRLFADESFTLSRLERVCSALDMSVADLARMTTGAASQRDVQEQPYSLTLEQERTLASNASLLACFYLLLNGRSVTDTGERLGLSQRAMRTFLNRLSAARLIDTDAGYNVRLHARLPIAWRPEGPVRKLYERQVRAEFLQGAFAASNEALSFHSAELSPASVRILLRKIEKLAADFADLAALDNQVPSRDKTSIALLLACRPWVFSMFSAYRTRVNR
ncbi:helix-turn-helix transcriptional regulator [Povalibacter sp.]|uniref:helix-turn-helix domain-containing protein n=1 Tax=Povalibacter sp. TaxID=1962978 RepID=UPI002F40C56F